MGFLRAIFGGPNANGWDYHDSSLRSPAEMASRPICSTMSHLDTGYQRSHLYFEERVTATMMHRLCHLIFRMESSPCWETANAAAWYLREMRGTARQMPADAQPYLAELQARLQQSLDRLKPYGTPDADAFQRFLSACGYGSSWELLYGPPLYSIIQPPWSDPRGRLSRYVNDYMWTQNSVSSL